MATVLEIINGISQAAANIGYDGAHEGILGDGEPRSAGLRREEGHLINDRRVIDGFGVKFMGDVLCITYHGEVQLKEVYANGFESEIEETIVQVANFLKKEYKAITGNTLSLTKQGESDILVQNRSRVWTWVQAQCLFKIGGINEVVAVDEEEDGLRDRFKDFLSLGSNK
tara:strand:- start:4601 stop:5110 length:510 start_codon:yes stop_codon:yes gene_type:complete